MRVGSEEKGDRGVDVGGGQVPEVDKETRRRAEEEMKAVWFEFREDMEELDIKIDEALARVSGNREYLSECLPNGA